MIEFEDFNSKIYFIAYSVAITNKAKDDSAMIYCLDAFSDSIFVKDWDCEDSCFLH